MSSIADSQKISIRKDGGPIVFLGSMNAMPMMYALELRKKGYDVLYFVDRPVSDALSRPENHFSEITYPYPDWIVEFFLPSQIALPYMRRCFAKKIKREVFARRRGDVQVYILNGLFISLAPYLGQDSVRVALSHGSDLDSWADVDGMADLSISFRRRSVFKYLPFFAVRPLIAIAVRRQYGGAAACGCVVYFPKGFNEFGDRVLRRLSSGGVRILERYDVSFEPLKNESRGFKEPGENLIVLSAVRFLFRTFVEGNEGYSKGNDIIIDGLARYCNENPRVQVHFVEKGPDVQLAKEMCQEKGLGANVIWHKEMRFIELLDLYRQADICFDQVGQHWIGAVGGYALWLGKPLIANDERPVRTGFWPKDNPVFSAASAEDVYRHLKALTDPDIRRKASIESKRFAEYHMSPSRLLSDLFEFCDG